MDFTSQAVIRTTALIVTCTLFIPIEFSLMSSASAAKKGSVCKKLNSKGWDGNKPIVCKKNKSGKLMWTEYKTTRAPAKYKLKITILELDEIYNDDRYTNTPEERCELGGNNFKDINANTQVQIRDGNGNLLMATGVLGPAAVIDGTYYPETYNCVFAPEFELKKSEFYQIEIGTRYSKARSFAELEKDEWQIELVIG